MGNAKTRTYRIVASGIVYVSTLVQARSPAEALRKAKAMDEHDWRESSSSAIDLVGHEVTDVC